MAVDRNGIELFEGETVILLEVTEQMLKDLPSAEAAFLLSMQGKGVEISDFMGVIVEVTMTDPDTGTIHFLYLPGDKLEKA